MPAESERQRRMMGADLGRLRAGKPTRTGMNEDQLRDFARKPSRLGGGRGKKKRSSNPRGQKRGRY